MPTNTRRISGLLAAVLCSVASLTLASGARTGSRAPGFAHLSSAPRYLSPGGRHKVRVSNPALARQLAAGGARTLAAYEGSVLLEVSGLTQSGLADTPGCAVRDEDNLVFLNAGRLDTTAAPAQALRTAALAPAGKQPYLLQFVGPVKPEWLKAVRETGVAILAYVPSNGYLVYGDPGALSRLRLLASRSGFVQWDAPYQNRYKLHPALTAGRVAPARGRRWMLADGSAMVSIQLVSDPPANAVTLQLLDAIRTGPVRQSWRVLGYLNVVAPVNPQALARLAARPDVVSVHPRVTPRKHDERQDMIMAGNLTGSSPTPGDWLAYLQGQGFDGTTFGFAVNVSDSGLDNGTPDPNHFALFVNGDAGPTRVSRVLYNRVEGTPNSGSSLAGVDGHGTENAHIIGGYVPEGLNAPHVDAQGFRHDIGVAPFVKLGSSVIFDPDFFTDPNYANLESEAYRDGARISSNSWGSSVFGAYNADAQTYDALVRDAQPAGASVPAAGNQEYVLCFSNGNDGSGLQTVGSPATGKNVISVGAAENVRPFGGADGCGENDAAADSADDVIDFSSRGPCEDGRHKPDLQAPGVHIGGGVWQASRQTIASGGNGAADPSFNATGVCGGTAGGFFFPTGQQWYTASSGTSHSCPAVSGACALVRQRFLNAGKPAPTPALTKAALMATARYMPGDGAGDSLWSDSQGMGEVQLTGFFGLFTSPSLLVEQSGANTFTASGQSRGFTANIQDNTKPVRITLAWTDAPGSTTGGAWVNDLDLEVTTGGQTLKGNVFSGAVSATGGTADIRNNVESVFLPAGTTGGIAVTVRASNIAGDATNAGSLSQDFALVVSNAQEVHAPLMSLASAVISAESFAPANGAPDPGENVTVNVSLQNVGTADTTNLVGTLQASGGVTSPSGPQTYGAVGMGSVVSKSYTFTASGTCGGTVTMTLALTDGAANLGTIQIPFDLGALHVTGSEAFDGVAAPALPAGWSTTFTGVGDPWTSVTTGPASPPNSAFVTDKNDTGSSTLLSPVFNITTAAGKLSFKNDYAFEATFDGGVLEISLDGGTNWQDVLAAGATFVSGGYNGAISSDFSNPLAGRQAWTGHSGSYLGTVLNLPAAAAGKAVRFRWICGSDEIFGDDGWFVDDVQVADGFVCGGEPTASVAFAAASASVLEGGTSTINVTRGGDTTGSSSVHFAASDGTAAAGSDYPAASGTLNFGPGDTTASFTVPTTADALLEGSETVNLTLSSPSNATLGLSAAVLTLTDDLDPPKPTGLTLSVSGAHSILVGFTDRCGNETGLELQRAPNGGSFATINTLAPKAGVGAVSFTDGTVAAGNSYFYRVRARNGSLASNFSANGSVTVGAPTAPVLSSATVLSARQVKLVWQDKSNNELNFKVEAKSGGGSFTTLATPPAGATTTSPGALNPDTDYTFHVLAQNGGGTTTSNEITAHTFAPPNPPVNVTAEALSGSQIRLVWASGGPHSDFWQIERSSDGTSFSVLTTLDKSILHYTDSGLPNGATRYYRLHAISGTTLSNPSLYAVGIASSVVSATTLRKPNPPTNLAATPLSATQIRLSWQSGDPVTDYFRIERQSGASWLLVTDVGKTVLFYTVNNLPPGQSFTFRVSAIAGTNLTNPIWYVLSNPAGPITASTLAAPAAPTNLTATAQAGKQIVLSWSENAATETEYRVERSTNGTSFTEIAQLPKNTTGYRNTGLTAGIAYSYRVRALSGSLFSAYSNTKSATAVP